jgi:hypothetical protein
MAYKTIRKDGRNITINTETGQEIKPGEGLLGDLLKQSGLTTLGSNLPSMFQQLGRDLSNLPRDISRATVYSDKVDDKGRPLTIAQANPEPYKPISGMAVAQGARPKASGTKIKIGDKYYDTGFHSKEISELRKQNPGGGNAAQSVTTGLNTGTGNRDAKLDPNATEQYASNFKAGQANMDNIQDMYSDRKDLQQWAKANPALAQVEFAKAEAKAVKSGKASSAYDAEESFKPSDIPEADRQNPADQAAALGIKNLTNDAQVFKDNAMNALLTASQNPNVTPIVEGMTIPTTTNYAGAFNQADMPDLQSMMNMGEQLGSLGIESPKFAQSQKFKDLFQNSMLSK